MFASRMILILSLIVLSTTLVQPQIKGTSIIQTGDVVIPEMKEIQSKPYFIKRKLKPIHTSYKRKNKKATNNEVAELTQMLKDSKSATNREITELKKQLNDSKSATNKEIAELKKQLKDSKSATNEKVMQMLKDMKTEVLGLHKFTTTEKMKNLDGKNVPRWEHMGPITLFNGNGNWEWKRNPSQTQEEINKIWSQIKTSKAGSNGIYSSPVVLPNEMGELYGSFGIWPTDGQEFEFGFYCYDVNHNQLIKYRLPISVNFKIQMSNQKGDILLDYTGTFKITQLHTTSGPLYADCAQIKCTDKIDLTQFPNIKLTLI